MFDSVSAGTCKGNIPRTLTFKSCPWICLFSILRSTFKPSLSLLTPSCASSAWGYFFFFPSGSQLFSSPPPKKKIVTVRTFGENNLSSEWFCPVLDQFKFSLSHGSMWQPRIIQAHWAESVAFGNGGTAAMPMYGSSQKLCWHTSCSHVKILFYMVNCYFSPLTFWNQLFWGKKYSCR